MANKDRIYQSSTFKIYMSKKRIFVFLLTLFFFLYYFSLPILTSYFPLLMRYEVIRSISFAWLFALSQFLMTWLICFLYVRKAKSFDIMVDKIKEEYVNRGNEK